MTQIKLKSLQIENFKGIRSLSVPFWDTTDIRAQNATGKTSTVDAFFWLLFDKDSLGNTKFSIRPLDDAGKMVDNVEIMVSGILDVDGKQIELKKTQKQKWVKKRGSSVATLQGNENVYEIDGFPTSEREYSDKVSDIVSEDLFKLVTNPRTFAAMKWQEQRKVLMEFVSDITDVDVMAEDPETYEPIMAEVTAAGVEKTLEKAKRAMQKLKEQQKEYPARIDEASRAIVPIEDIDALTANKARVEQQIQDVRANIDSNAKQFSVVGALQSDIMAKKFEISEIENAIKMEAVKALNEAREEHAVKNNAANDLFFRKRDMETKVRNEKTRLEFLEQSMKDIRERYLAIRDETLPEDAEICPTCCQVFPPDKVEQIRADYEESKARRLADCKASGDKCNAEIADLKKSIEQHNAELDSFQQQWTEAAQAESKAYEHMEELSKAPAPDHKANPDYQKAQEALENLQAQLLSMNTGEDAKQALRDRERALQAELGDINRQLAAVDANARAEERVEALRKEQLAVGQQVADQEQKVCLLEELTRAKMEMLSEKINAQFDVVNFKLFENLINGGYKDTCEMTVNGVPYSSLNSAAKIQGGLDVIKALSRLYGVSAPIFIDNRESTIEIPAMDAQIINLYVDDRYSELHIEQGEE